MDPRPDPLVAMTRRELFRSTGTGLGAIALAALLDGDRPASAAADDPSATPAPHFAPRAKHVIFLHMVGAPSHLDLFEPKPELVRHDGELVPERLIEGKRFAF